MNCGIKVPGNARLFLQPHGYQTLRLRILLAVLALIASGCADLAIFPSRAPTPQSQAEAAPEPAIGLEPANGYAGTYVQVTGSGWPAQKVVTVMLADGQNRSGILVAANTEPDGTFTTGFLYPLADRWLSTGTRFVVVEAAGGRHQVQAAFGVVPPAVVDVPAAMSSPSPTSTATAIPTPVETPAPVASPTPVPAHTPAIVPSPTLAVAAAVQSESEDTPASDQTAATQLYLTLVEKPAAAQVDPAPANKPATTQVDLAPAARDANKQLFRVSATATDPAGNEHASWAVLEMPPVGAAGEIKIKLKRKKNLQIKWKKKGLEIEGPDPEALLAQLRGLGGIIVPDGQLVRIERKTNGNPTLKVEDGVLELAAPAISLKAVSVDADGLLNVDPEARVFAFDDDEPFADEDDDDEDDDDEDDDDEDDDDEDDDKEKGKKKKD